MRFIRSFLAPDAPPMASEPRLGQADESWASLQVWKGGAEGAVVEDTDVIPGNATTPFSISVGGQETGTINGAGDRDWFQITVTGSDYYLFTVTGAGGQMLSNASIDIFNAAGTHVGHAGGEGTETNLIWAGSSNGTYFVSVGAQDNVGTGGYTVSAALSSPTDAINWGQTMSTTSIQVYFASSGQTFNGETATRSWTSAERSAAMSALATYSAFTTLTFSQTNNVGNAQLVLTLTDLESGVLGYADVGTPYVYFDPNEAGWTSAGLQQGGYGFVTLIHEFGHALGLAHPHDQGGGSPLMPGAALPYGYYGVYGFNQGVFTTMTYNDAWPLGPTPSPSVAGLGWQGTPMSIDIALLQEFYGVNTTYNNTNTTYALSASDSMYRAIWDTGGVDTISFAGSAAATIDLRAATMEWEDGGAGMVSYVSGVSGGFTIAAGVLIENATGGGGNDTITGNSAANVLNGSGGADMLSGRGGGDTLNGGAGDDVIYALQGDTIDGGDGIDSVTIDLSASTSSINWNTAQVSSNTGAVFGTISVRNIEAYNLTTGSGNDVLTTTAVAADSFWVAGGGVDQFVGDFSLSAQAVNISFNSGSSTFYVVTGGHTLQLIYAELLTLAGGSAGDQMQGGALGDVIAGNGGDDALYGAGGDDAIRGDAGADNLAGGDGVDTLDGGDGADVLSGDAGADIMRGGVGDDTLYIAAGDWADGGDGRDQARVLMLSASAAVFDATQAATNAGFTFGDGTHVRNVEWFRVDSGEIDTLVIANHLQAGSSWQASRTHVDRLSLDLSAVSTSINMQFFIADPIVQSGLRTDISWGGSLQFQVVFVDTFTIAGGAAGDVLRGHDLADNLVGNGGDDTLNGGGGADVLSGGAGIDTSVYSVASTASSWVRNLDGSWTVTAGANGVDTLSGVEFIDFTDRDVFLDRAATNFSGDGTSDILLRRTDGVTAIWSMDGAAVTGAGVTQWQAGSDWQIQGVGDFNSDGRDDFLLRRLADGVTAIWSMNGTSVIAADVTLWQAGNEWQIQAVGDFNCDGSDDFLWRRTNDGVTAIWQMNGTNVVAADVTLWQAGNEWQIQGVGDFNGDGRDDFLWRRTSDGVTAIWSMSGANVLGADVTSQTAGNDWSFVGIGDFNGDGRDDLLLRRNDGATAIWLMNGTSVIGSGVTSQQAGADWNVAAIGDYNGDGRDDILIRHDSGIMAVWTMNGFVVSSAITTQTAGPEWTPI